MTKERIALDLASLLWPELINYAQLTRELALFANKLTACFPFVP